jgi:hypothetical protein
LAHAAEIPMSRKRGETWGTPCAGGFRSAARVCLTEKL